MDTPSNQCHAPDAEIRGSSTAKLQGQQIRWGFGLSGYICAVVQPLPILHCVMTDVQALNTKAMITKQLATTKQLNTYRILS